MRQRGPWGWGIVFSTLLCLFFPAAVPAATAPVYMVQLDDDTINPVTAEYIAGAIDLATEARAQALIIKLDTPGGVLSSTRTIVKRILSSPVPVVVYIAPSGSRAGSAGVFITYASHIAAMAPSTNIGAAHPVSIGGEPGRPKEESWDELKDLLKDIREELQKSPPGDKNGTPQKDSPQPPEDSAPEGETGESKPPVDNDPMGSKILNDTVAFIKTLAQKRNRNSEWAVKSVRESASITETEALAMNVVDLIAKDEGELLEKLDGRTVTIGETEIVLKTRGAPVKFMPMTERQKFFNTLANPNIAYILFIIGFYGLLYEVTHPGFGVPGIVGLTCLILAFFSMQTLPTNLAGLALIILGISFFVVEAVVPGFGLFMISGIICTFLGSLLLFDTDVPALRVSIPLIVTFTGMTAALTVFLVGLVIRVYRRKALGGTDGLVGEKGEALHEIAGGREGKVFVHGEIWNATSDEDIKKGEAIFVRKVDGMMLTVKKFPPTN